MQETFNEELDRMREFGIEGTEKYRDALILAGHLKGLTSDQLLHQRIERGIRALDNARRGLDAMAKELQFERDAFCAERGRLRFIKKELGLGDGIEADVAVIHMPGVKKIAASVAEKHSISVDDLKSSKRHNHIVVARHEAFYLSLKYTSLSSPQIGNFFNKDYSTVLQGAKKHEERMGRNE